MLILLSALLVPRAYAVDVDTYRPSGSGLSGEGGFQVVTPGVAEARAIYGGFVFSYAANTVVPAGEGAALQPALRHLVGARLVAGYTVGRALRLDVDVPTYPWVGFSDSSLSGPAWGDIRARAVIVLAPGDGPGEGLALVPTLSAPTGRARQLLGGSGVGAGIGAAVGIRPVPALLIAANLGLDSSPVSDLEARSFGGALHAAGGLEWAATESLGIGVEVDGDIDLQSPLVPTDPNPVEAHAYAAFGPATGLAGTVGAGTGLIPGVGTPDLRLVLGIVWRAAGTGPVRDTDRDGLVDHLDRCPSVAEDSDGFEDIDGCPDPDDDKDGIPDDEDACRDRAEDRDAFEDHDGCPEADNDRDGVIDTADRCPAEPGLVESDGCPDADGDRLDDHRDRCPGAWGPSGTQGCPDTDGDGITDATDLCPDDPSEPPVDGSPPNGCPAAAQRIGDRIVLVDDVHFVAGSLTLEPLPNPGLDALARLLNARPEIRRVEIGGHTDTEGDRAANVAISQARAEAVMKYLIIVGRVDPSRLLPVGYGDRYPIDTNETLAGRAHNRRVDFVIVP